MESNFGATEGVLGFADARANGDLSSFYDFKATPRSFTLIPAQKSIQDFIDDNSPMTAPDND